MRIVYAQEPIIDSEGAYRVKSYLQNSSILLSKWGQREMGQCSRRFIQWIERIRMSHELAWNIVPRAHFEELSHLARWQVGNFPATAEVII